MTTDAAHGYTAYTHGCRCQICRAAKADYARKRRSSARALANAVGNARYANGRHFVPGIKHGRYGYEERGCRCDVCLDARASQQRDLSAKRRLDAGAS